VDGVLHKECAYMAKMEFNTGIETLTIFLVSVVAAMHGRALSSLRWKPCGPCRGMGPADLRERRKKESLTAQVELSSRRRSGERSRARLPSIRFRNRRLAPISRAPCLKMLGFSLISEALPRHNFRAHYYVFATCSNGRRNGPWWSL
jgi:hypothetical protein